MTAETANVEDLERLAVAAHLIGADDWVDRWADACRAPLEVIDGAAHAPHIETPERFVTALATLLDDQPRQGNGIA